MRSPKKKICHRDRNYMIYVLTFLIALTGMLGISKGSPVQAAEEESTQKGSISLVCPVEGMELSLYRVAEYEESGSFTLTERFRKYPQRDITGGACFIRISAFWIQRMRWFLTKERNN